MYTFPPNFVYECLSYLEDSSFESEFDSYQEDLVEVMSEKFSLSVEDARNMITYKNLLSVLKNLTEENSKLRKREKKKDDNDEETVKMQPLTPEEEQHKKNDSTEKDIQEYLVKNNISLVNLKIDHTTYPKAFVVLGDTKNVKDKIKSLGGKWNPTLKGWIFSKKVVKDVKTSHI